MIRVLGKIPNKITIAVSGGPDSMAALDFLSRRRDVSAAFFHHDTDASEKGFSLVKTYCEKHGIEFSVSIPITSSICFLVLSMSEAGKSILFKTGTIS